MSPPYFSKQLGVGAAVGDRVGGSVGLGVGSGIRIVGELVSVTELSVVDEF
jgi:hypothetical protein